MVDAGPPQDDPFPVEQQTIAPPFKGAQTEAGLRRIGAKEGTASIQSRRFGAPRSSPRQFQRQNGLSITASTSCSQNGISTPHLHLYNAAAGVSTVISAVGGSRDNVRIFSPLGLICSIGAVQRVTGR